MAKWYITWHNGKVLLGLDSSGKPIEVKEDTPSGDFLKKDCADSNTALCSLDLSKTPIYAKALTMYITSTH